MRNAFIVIADTRCRNSETEIVGGDGELDLNTRLRGSVLLSRAWNLPIGRDNASSFVTRLSNAFSAARARGNNAKAFGGVRAREEGADYRDCRNANTCL